MIQGEATIVHLFPALSPAQCIEQENYKAKIIPLTFTALFWETQTDIGLV